MTHYKSSATVNSCLQAALLMLQTSVWPAVRALCRQWLPLQRSPAGSTRYFFKIFCERLTLKCRYFLCEYTSAVVSLNAVASARPISFHLTLAVFPLRTICSPLTKQLLSFSSSSSMRLWLGSAHNRNQVLNDKRKRRHTCSWIQLRERNENDHVPRCMRW